MLVRNGRPQDHTVCQRCPSARRNSLIDGTSLRHRWSQSSTATHTKMFLNQGQCVEWIIQCMTWNIPTPQGGAGCLPFCKNSIGARFRLWALVYGHSGASIVPLGLSKIRRTQSFRTAKTSCNQPLKLLTV